MGREIGFMDFNIRNILTNLHQAEDHYRNLSEDSDELGHKSCITKHVMMASGESGEGISHASVVNPSLVGNFREIKNNSDKFVSEMGELDNREGIREIRRIRKIAEKLDPNYDTSRCKACGEFEERLENYDDETKGLNRGTNKFFNMKDNMKALVGSFVGKGISEVTSRYVSGSNFGIANKTLVNIGVGLGIDLLYLKKRKGKTLLPAKMEVPLVSAANFLIADEVGDLVAGYIPSAGVRMAPVARIAPTVSIGNGGVPQFANGKHIYVD